MNTDKLPRRMTVKRIVTSDGYRYDPGLDPAWGDLAKLEWLAGVVHADTGLNVRVREGAYRIDGVPQVGYYNVIVAMCSRAAMTFQTAWDFMAGVSVGYQEHEHERLQALVERPRGGQVVQVELDPPHGPSQQEVADAAMRMLRRQGRLRF